MKSMSGKIAMRETKSTHEEYYSRLVAEDVKAGNWPRPRCLAGTSIAALVLCLLLAPQSAEAKPPHAAASAKPEMTLPGGQKALGTFGGWRAFSFEEQGQTVCYMALPIRAAKQTSGKTQKQPIRGASRITITHRPSENSRDVVSFSSGYPLRPGSDVTVAIGKASFSMFTAQSSAWARDPATDRALAKTLRHASSLTITGSPAKQGATEITDKLDLSGADQAYRAMSKACGIEVPVETRPKPVAAKKPTTQQKHKQKDATASKAKQEPIGSKNHAISAPPTRNAPYPSSHPLPTGHAPKVPPARNQVE